MLGFQHSLQNQPFRKSAASDLPGNRTARTARTVLPSPYRPHRSRTVAKGWLRDNGINLSVKKLFDKTAISCTDVAAIAIAAVAASAAQQFRAQVIKFRPRRQGCFYRNGDDVHHGVTNQDEG